MKKVGAFLIFMVAFAQYLPAQTTRQTILFNNNWKFYKGDHPNAENVNTIDTGWRSVDLPHDWSIEGPFSNQWASGTGFLPGGIGWYRKDFSLNQLQPGDKVFIYFDGVYKNSEVWLNGQYLGKRPNGYIPFQYEMTPHLKKGNNVVAVKVDQSKFADSRWYPGSGIYRNVHVIIKKSVHIPLWGVRFETPVVSEEQALAHVAVSITNTLPAAANMAVESKLSIGAKTVSVVTNTLTVAANTTQDTKMSFPIRQPKLWSVETPHLYTLTVSVYKDGKKTDEYVEKVGFRSIAFDAQKGFFLNGKNMKLKGACIHHDAGALGAAVPREVWLRRLVKLKQAGCNAIRMSHYPHQDYLYSLCDELGLLVQDEAFDEWEFGKNKWIEGWNAGKPGKDGYHEHFNEWAERDLRDMVWRNRNHPSIIMWSIGNEIDYPNDPYSHEVLNTGRNPQIYGKGYLPDHPPASRLGDIAEKLAKVVKEADSTRPVTAALAGVVMSNTTRYPQHLDVVGYNYQEYRYAEDHANYPDRIIYGSENSRSPEAWRAVDTSENIFGQFVWTGFDFLGEAGRWPVRSSGAGLMDLAGFPKTDYFIRQTLWLDTPVLYLVAGRIRGGQPERGFRTTKPSWNWNKGDSIRVNCITNAGEAELLLNGQSLGKRSKQDTTQRELFWLIPYEPGELLAKGFDKGKEVSSYKLVTTSTPTTLEALADKKGFAPGKKELAHIEMYLKDHQGNIVYEATNEITVDISGPAILLGLESGDLASHENYKSNKRKAYNGKLLAYVQSTGRPGTVAIIISSPGLDPVVHIFSPD
jgi:beta-galactosidase/beta-glucuronidase